MFLYQDHGESCSCGGSHRLEENHRLLPENRIQFIEDKEECEYIEVLKLYLISSVN